jgi:hypothetical protein
MPRASSTGPEPSGAGSPARTFAISMIPTGWVIAAGDYHVVVSGISEPIEYDVQVVSCL